MSVGRYWVSKKASADLESQAVYLANEGGVDLGHRFLEAAERSFGLLASQPQLGWHPRMRREELKELRLFQVIGFEKVLILYQPLRKSVRILRVVHGSRNLVRFFGVEGLK